MTMELPYGKHFRVKKGPFAGRIGLWDGVFGDAYVLAFPDRLEKRSLWFQICDLEGPLRDKELVPAGDASKS